MSHQSQFWDFGLNREALAGGIRLVLESKVFNKTTFIAEYERVFEEEAGNDRAWFSRFIHTKGKAKVRDDRRLSKLALVL